MSGLPHSDRPVDIAGGPVRATNGSRVLFDQLVGLSKQRVGAVTPSAFAVAGLLNRGAR